jgi:hypothetical protein
MTPVTPKLDPPPPPAAQKQFPIDLDGKKGVLSVPASMSQKDYDLLQLQMEHYLKLLKLTSVASAEGQQN